MERDGEARKIHGSDAVSDVGRMESTKNSARKDLELSAMEIDWKQERLDADCVLRSLHESYCEDEKHRKWLLRRWPDWPSEILRSSLPDPERFMPELFLRDRENDFSQSLQSIKDLVRGSLDLLQQEEAAEGGQLDFPKGIARFSDEGIVEAVPLLLPKLQRQALNSILCSLSGRKSEARNRPWLIKKINEEWTSFVGQSNDPASRQILKRLLQVFRDPNSFLEEVPTGRILLEATCPLSAAHSALDQLQQLPLTCLHVMLEVLLDKPPEVMVGKLPVGANKERVVTALWGKGTALLSDQQEGDILPESLRKSLIVMSVSARYAFGDDGNLIDFLGPISLETKILHDQLLSALSDLKTLDFDSLQEIHGELIGTPKSYSKRHPGYVRQSIRKILLECLLRSEVRSVPEEIKNVSLKIRGLARQQSGKYREAELISRPKVAIAGDARIDLEVEATLRISSHLQQILYNRNEVLLERSFKDKISQTCLLELDTVDCNVAHGTEASESIPRRLLDTGSGARSDSLQFVEKGLAIHVTDKEHEGMETQLHVISLNETVQTRNQQVGSTGVMTVAAGNTPTNLQRCEVCGPPLAEAMEIQHLTRTADEVAKVGYALVGCAMERTARSSGISLKRPVRKYLRSRLKRRQRTGTGNQKGVAPSCKGTS